MTTLGSWIDDEALTQVIRDLCPDMPHAPLATIRSREAPRENAEAVAPANSTENDPDEESVPLESLPPAVPTSNASGSPAALVSRLTAVKQRAQRSGLIGGASKATLTSSSEAPFSPPADTFAVRLEALSEWIKVQFNASHVCLSDSRGESLTDAPLPVGLAEAAALLADALYRSQSEANLETSNALHSALENGKVLTVIAAPAAEGLFSISLIGAAPLSHRDIDHCRNGFYAAIET